MEENFSPNSFTLQVDNSNALYLKEAAKWAKFLAIVGFSVCAIILLLAIFYSSIFSSTLSELNNEVQGASNIGSIVIIIYIVIIVGLYFFPLLYLYNFGSKLQKAIRSNDQISLTASFRNLKSCLKFLGYLTIFVLCIYAIGILFAMLGAAFMH